VDGTGGVGLPVCSVGSRVTMRRSVVRCGAMRCDDLLGGIAGLQGLGEGVLLLHRTQGKQSKHSGSLSNDGAKQVGCKRAKRGKGKDEAIRGRSMSPCNAMPDDRVAWVEEKGRTGGQGSEQL
jgi:hypothetical protein